MQTLTKVTKMLIASISKQDSLTWPTWCQTAWHDYLDAGCVLLQGTSWF